MEAQLKRGKPLSDDLISVARAINREHDQVRQCVAQGLAHAKRAGELLQQAKAALPHGQWLPWLAAHCEVSERTAQAYMQIAARWQTIEAAKAQRVADLPMREALTLLADPRPAASDPVLGEDDPVVVARWVVWEDSWRKRTGEEPPLRPRELWHDTIGGFGALVGSVIDIPMPELTILHAWYADCVLHICAWPVLLRTGACPPAPPCWSFDIKTETQAQRWRAEHNREIAWELCVQREAGQYFNRCDQLGALDSKNRIRSEWTANVAEARTLLRELMAVKRDHDPDCAELAETWTDEEAATWARGYVYAPWWKRIIEELNT